MKKPVIIPPELSGFEHLTSQEQHQVYTWFHDQKVKLNQEPDVQRYLQMAERREQIYLECVAKHGEYTAAMSEEFKRRCKAEMPDWAEAKKPYEAKYKVLEQELNRMTLAMTWQKQTSHDVLGRPFLTPDEWLDQFDHATTLQRHRMELPYVSPVRPEGKEPFYADRLIADNLKTILDYGFSTSESCSGMLADHPDRRHYRDSPDNGETYKEGQPVHQTLYGSNAYVSFPKPESRWNTSLKNTPEQIEMVKRIAQENGWVTIDADSLLQPALRLELPMTYDGSSIDEIITEAKKIGEQTIPGFNALSYPDKVAAMVPLNKQVAQKHGGIVPWTDQLIKYKWNALSEGLKRAVEQQRMQEAELNRITEIAVITKRDGEKAIRCKIDGNQQSMKDVHQHFADAMVTGRLSSKEVCVLLYKEELSSTQQLDNRQHKGMKI